MVLYVFIVQVSQKFIAVFCSVKNVEKTYAMLDYKPLYKIIIYGCCT